MQRAKSLIVSLILLHVVAAVATPEPAEVQSSPLMDTDRNRIFDDADAALADKPSDWKMSVIVVLTVKPTGEIIDELKTAVGNFLITSNQANTSAEGIPWDIIDAFSANLTKDQITLLAGHDYVRQIEMPLEGELAMDGAKQESGVNKAKIDFGVEGDRDGQVKTYGPEDIVICVIDSGIDPNHVDLDEGQVIGWKDFDDPLNQVPVDTNGHGTHVAGIAAGQGDGNPSYRGIAEGAALVGVRLAPEVLTADAVTAIQWCNNNKGVYGIEIINLSLRLLACTDGTDATSLAADAAWKNGIVVVVAAGNAGPQACSIGSPGVAKHVITVGMMGYPGNYDDCLPSGTIYAHGWYLHEGSGRGPTLDGRVKPDISAPGVCVTAPKAGTSADYIKMTGTSMATPFISGIVALMLDANSTLTPDQVKEKLHSTAQDWGKPDQAGEPQSNEYGAGRVRAHSAVESACDCGDLSEQAAPAHFFAEEDLAGQGSMDSWSISVTDVAYSVSATLTVPEGEEGRSFIMKFYAPSGALLADTTGEVRPDMWRAEVVSNATSSFGTGQYELRVISENGGGDYFVDVSAGASGLMLNVDE